MGNKKQVNQHTQDQETGTKDNKKNEMKQNTNNAAVRSERIIFYL